MRPSRRFAQGAERRQLRVSLQVLRLRVPQAAQDCAHPAIPLRRGLARRRAAQQHVHGQVARRAAAAIAHGDESHGGAERLLGGDLLAHPLPRGLPQQAARAERWPVRGPDGDGRRVARPHLVGVGAAENAGL